MLWVTISMRKIVGGVVRHCDFVVKIKCETYFMSCLSLIREIFPAILFYPELLLQEQCTKNCRRLLYYSHKLKIEATAVELRSRPLQS